MQCDVCKSPDRLFRDHSHVTGLFRGMLCNSCNITLSTCFDDPALMLARAERYETMAEGMAQKLNGPTLYSEYQQSRISKKIAQAKILRALCVYIGTTHGIY